MRAAASFLDFLEVMFGSIVAKALRFGAIAIWTSRENNGKENRSTTPPRTERYSHVTIVKVMIAATRYVELKISYVLMVLMLYP